MQTLYLHAGMMKTGSTSIQVSLAANPQGRNYLYLSHQANNSSEAMRRAFAGGLRGRGRPAFSQPDFRERFLADLDQQLRQEVPIGVLSAEMISEPFMAPHHRGIHEWLTARVPQVKVVVYVREPASFMESVYQQKLQAVGQPTLRPNALYPKYRRRFEPMEAVFGRENIVYRGFAPSRFHRGDIVWDLAQAIGLEPSKAFQPRRANDSLSRRAATLLQVYQHHLPAGHDLRLSGNEQKRRLLRLLHAIKGPKVRLAPDVLHKVVSRQHEDVAWMNSRLDAPLPEFNAAGEGEYIRDVQELFHPDERSLAWLGELSGQVLGAGDGPAIAAALAQLSQVRGFQTRLAQTRRMFS